MIDSIALNKHYSANNAAPYPITLVTGDGIYVTDEQGKRYIDMVSGISVTNFGHKPAVLLAALSEQANKIAIVPRLFHNQPLCQLMQSICQACAMDKAIPMNSGAEAVESAIKVVRKWGYVEKNIPDNQAEIIVCDENFHGRTITAVSASTVDKYKKNFGPLTPGFVSIPFNNPAALEKAINRNTAAFIVEPIQGEAGVIIPDADYLQQCQNICKRHNVMFIVDEIQSGMGRTGKLLACHHENIQPDAILMGKALGGGLLPISLLLGKEHLMKVMQPGEHGGTFGGNPLASFVAYHAVKQLTETNLLSHASEIGDYFTCQLQTIHHSGIHAIRGKGLFIAIEFKPNMVSASDVFEKLAESGLLTINTRNNTLRLLPALIITKAQVDQAVEIIKTVLENYHVSR